MFYQELYQICNNDRPFSKEIIESVDAWLAFIPINQQDKITVGRVANKFNIDFYIARALLEELAEINILQRIFAIKCPNCGFVLKVTDESNIISDIQEVQLHKECVSCDKEIKEIEMDNIEVRYKLLKKPTIDPTKMKEKLKNEFGLSKSSSFKKDSLSNLIKEANYNSNNLFYKPTEEEHLRLQSLLRGVINAHTKKEKGDSLEDLVEYLLNRIKGVTATKNAETNTNQLDCFAVINQCIPNYTLNRFGHTFICECKNEAKKPANGYFHKLANILNISRIDKREHKFGIIFSREEPPKTYLEMAYKNYYMTNITIITFSLSELKEIINNKKNFLNYIDLKINTVEQDLKVNESTSKIFTEK